MKQNRSMSSDEIYLRHILEAIEKIERYTNGLTRNAFERSDLVIDGVIRELEIIGEAARNIGKAFQQDHSDIPFAKMIGMRNLLIHEYFGVNVDLVWKTVTEDLPVLMEQVQAAL